MIYAQRPDATACASFDIWNNRMNRYVRRGSKGIALLDQSSSVPRLHYVFDVSDTGVRRNSRDPEVWQLGPDLVQPVSEMIAREYGVYHERLSRQISDLTGKLVDSYWDNNGGDIRAIVDGSLLMDYDEAGVEMQFKSAAAMSCRYAAIRLCSADVHAAGRITSTFSVRTVCSVRVSVISSFTFVPKRRSHSAQRSASSRSCVPCKSDVSVLWMLTAAGAAAAALFSSSFICGASRNRITRIYSPATAFMHLPAQPAPASSVVISAQIQAMQNADAAV